ncbi:MAG: sulfurtransferase, partial [Caldilineae bacterium]
MFTTLISTEELAARLGDPQTAIIDCRFSLDDTERGRREYLRAHIPGAVYAHLDEDLSGPVVPGKTSRHPLPKPEDFARRVGEWGIDDETQVVVYD